jgi:AcrR family transcriptional regulator
MALATSTPDRLLDAAERLFAEHGVERTSLRQITTLAEANLAAVNYHFGSKMELVQAVFARRLEPMNAERLALLDGALGAAREAGRSPELEQILRAFLAPALSLGHKQGREFFVFIARAHASPDPELQRTLAGQFEEIAGRFGAALTEVLPWLTREDLFWRVHFVVGALCHTVVNTPILTAISDGLCTADDEDAVLQRLVDFCTAGLAAGAHSR